MEEDRPTIEQNSKKRRHPSINICAISEQKVLVPIWGSGVTYREFFYLDDMAAANLQVMNFFTATYDHHNRPMFSHIHVGCGEDIRMRQLAETMAKTVGYTGAITFAPSQTDGTSRNSMNSISVNTLGGNLRVA